VACGDDVLHELGPGLADGARHAVLSARQPSLFATAPAVDRE